MDDEMSWIYLILAGMFEVGGVIGLKRSADQDTWTNSIIMLGSFAVSLSFLSLAMDTITLGVAYAVWTAIGTVGAAVVGVWRFGERMSKSRWLCLLGMIVVVAALRLTESSEG